MAEAAIALSYPEPYNQGKLLGIWLSFRVGGQILGGAVNLGLNADRNEAGSVSYSVFQVFIALQAVAPFAGLLLTAPGKVERTDGEIVSCSIGKEESSWKEFVSTAKLFAGKKFLLIIPLISQSVFAEAVFFTYQGLWFSVRARALGSFLSGIVAIAAGNVLGLFLDHTKWQLRMRARGSFIVIIALQGAWWVWGTILVTEYHKSQPTLDWVDSGFSRGFFWFLFMVGSFQINYLYLYFVIGKSFRIASGALCFLRSADCAVGQLAKNDAEVIRYAGILRGTESAAQAVSYGLVSLTTMGQFGAVYVNFALWAVSIVPAWFVIKEFGVRMGRVRDERSDEKGRGPREIEAPAS